MSKLFDAYKTYFAMAALTLLLAAAGFALYKLYSHGKQVGQSEQREEINERIREANRGRRLEAEKTLARAQRTGARFEKDRAGLDALFETLEKEALNVDQTQLKTAIDSAACELPAERLRIWRAANAGFRAGAEDRAAGQPDAAPAAAAAANQRPDGGAGGQSSASGQGLSPARGAAVWPARIFRAAVQRPDSSIHPEGQP